MRPVTPDERLLRYARLAVEVGINLQAGQLCESQPTPEHLPLVRAIAEVAYARGARYVEAIYVDPHIRRSRILHAPEDTLDWSPPWSLELIDQLASTHGATDRDHRRPGAGALRRSRPEANREGAREARCGEDPQGDE